MRRKKGIHFPHKDYAEKVAGRQSSEVQKIEEDELKYLGERVKLLLDLAIRSCEDKIQQILKEPNKYIKK